MAQLGLSNGASIPHAHTHSNGSSHLPRAGKAGGSTEKKPALSAEERRIQREARAQAAALKRQVQPSRRSGRVAAMASKADYTGYVLCLPSRALSQAVHGAICRRINASEDEHRTDRSAPAIECSACIGRLMHRDGSLSPAPMSPPSQTTPSRPSIPKAAPPYIPSGPEYDLTADDEGQYEARAPPPTREADGTLVFEGRWKGVFTPNVTPEEMFRGGAFGGAFFWYVSICLS